MMVSRSGAKTEIVSCETVSCSCRSSSAPPGCIANSVPIAAIEKKARPSASGNADDGAPPRGSPDSDVLDHARRTNQIVVTSNHDMVMLCAEEGHSVIWVDPWGRQFSREAWVLLVFTPLARWDQLFSVDDNVCIRALRSRCEAVSLDETYEMAEWRFKRIRARRARRSRSAQVNPGQSQALQGDLTVV
jgi:hypothetical protein